MSDEGNDGSNSENNAIDNMNNEEYDAMAAFAASKNLDTKIC